MGVILCATADSSGVRRCESDPVALIQRDGSARHDPRLLARASVHSNDDQFKGRHERVNCSSRLLTERKKFVNSQVIGSYELGPF